MPADDPYRTLGLERGASLDEVKRAYRRLAKANHPDAAGEAALPRFLAIQAAYDQIAGPDARTGRPAAAARRRRRGRPTPTGPARRTARTAAGRDRDRGPRPGTRGRDRIAAAGGHRRRGIAARHGTAVRARPAPATPATAEEGDARSTSYDDVDAEPFDPDWGGASWYGTTSGHLLDAQPQGVRGPAQARAGVPGAGAGGAGRAAAGDAGRRRDRAEPAATRAPSTGRRRRTASHDRAARPRRRPTRRRRGGQATPAEPATRRRAAPDATGRAAGRATAPRTRRPRRPQPRSAPLPLADGPRRQTSRPTRSSTRSGAGSTTTVRPGAAPGSGGRSSAGRRSPSASAGCAARSAAAAGSPPIAIPRSPRLRGSPSCGAAGAPDRCCRASPGSRPIGTIAIARRGLPGIGPAPRDRRSRGHERSAASSSAALMVIALGRRARLRRRAREVRRRPAAPGILRPCPDERPARPVRRRPGVPAGPARDRRRRGRTAGRPPRRSLATSASPPRRRARCSAGSAPTASSSTTAVASCG